MHEGFRILDRRWVLFETLGQGGMGIVFRGRHHMLDDEVAVKCLSPGFLHLNDELLSRFRKEGKAATLVKDPHVIAVRDLSEDAGVHFIIMEYVQGANLRELVHRHGSLKLADALRIAYGLALGLAAIHESGLVHRDIKPGNALVAADGRIKVADLGLVKFVEDESFLTMSGTSLGTKQYMAPEQFEAPQEVDASADVYALGATLYFLLTGEDPVPQGTFLQVARFVHENPFPDVRKARPDVPASVSKLIQDCTCLEPGDRLQSGRRVAAYLKKLLGSRAGSQVSPTVLRRVAECIEERNESAPPPADTMARIQELLKQRGQFGSPPLAQNAPQARAHAGAAQVLVPGSRLTRRRRSQRKRWTNTALNLAVAAGLAWGGVKLFEWLNRQGVVDRENTAAAQADSPSVEGPTEAAADEVLRAPSPDALDVDLAFDPGRYRGRFDALPDKERLRGNGGKGTANAVAAGLAWLAAHQDQSGAWDCDRFDKHDPLYADIEIGEVGGGDHHQDVGVTGLALLAFLGDGHTTRTGKYVENVERAVAWLLDQQEEDSGLFGESMGTAFLYDHAIATEAICEAYYFARSPDLKKAAQAAIDYSSEARNPYSAWRYRVPPDGDSDTSVTGWMIRAMKAAEEAGLTVDGEAYAAAIAFLDEMTDQGTGRVGYTQRGSPSSRVPRINQEKYPTESGEALTAVALVTRLLAGQDPENEPVIMEHAALLHHKLPQWEANGFTNDMYYWAHGTQAMFQIGGRHWDKWNEAMKKTVVESQRQYGPRAGSWDPIGPWGYSGGRVYSTAMMLFCLEIYYRAPRILDEGDE